MKFFLKKVLFLYFILVISTAFCEARTQQFLMIEDSESEASKTISYNLKKTMADASLATRAIDKKELLDFSFEMVSEFSGIVFTSDSSSDYLYGPDAIRFVEEGGTMVFAHHSYPEDYIEKFGIKPVTTIANLWNSAKGIKSVKPVFRETRFELATGSFTTGCMNISFSKEWEQLLSFAEPDIPLLATRKFGNGSVVYWNSSCLSSKLYRGIFLFSLLKSLPVSAMSVHNAFLMHLDDSPPPAYGIMEGPVARDLGMKDYDFHKRVWVKQVFPILDSYKLALTHFLTFTYDGKIQGPFQKKSDREPFFSDYLKLLRERGDDFGFHGYNHQSLTMGKSPSTPWTSRKEMADSVRTGYQLWNEMGLPPTLAYVPPNNVIDETGKLVISEEFPSIRVICRVYNDGDEYYSRNSSGFLAGIGKVNNEAMKKILSLYASRRAMTSPKAREFFRGDEYGVDPENPKFLNLPRLSSGHFLTEFEQAFILNGIMAHGIAVHFFHPDDIYDPSRREKSWEYTLAALKRLLIFFNKNFDFARKIHTSSFLTDFKKYVFGNAEIQIENSNLLKIKTDGRRFFYLFCGNNKSVEPLIEGGKILSKVDENVYLIELSGKEASVEFQRKMN